MTIKRIHALQVAVAFVLAATVGVSSANAQISFGKMRDAAEKGGAAPTLDDEDEDAFDVSPTSKNAKKPSASVKPRVKPSAKTNGAASEKNASASENAKDKNAEDESVLKSEETDGASTPSDSALTAPKTGPNAGSRRPAPGRGTAAPRGGSAANSAAKQSQDASDPASAGGKAIGENGRGPRLGRAVSHKYRAGMIFQAQPGGTCVNVFGSAPVPTEFPEQKVRTLEEEFPKQAKVDYRNLKEGGARQLVFKMRELRGGNGVQASALFEVTRYPILPPTEPEIYQIPSRVSPDIRRYLRESKYMESNTKTVRSLAKETTGDYESAWEKVDAILRYVRSNIQYKEVLIEKPMRGALAALKTNEGDCEDMSALFISMCRAIDVPARLVRVPGHCWAEFYLVDDEKQGFWFPAQVAGTEELGSLQDNRVILQKGDSFRVPEEPKEEQLYVKELFMGTVKDGGPDPKYQFIQETDGK